MAVRCEYIDIIVPITNIDRVYLGGFAGFKREHESHFGHRLWHDLHLLRDGAFCQDDLTLRIAFWRDLGLEPGAEGEAGSVWRDLCVVKSIFGGPTLPCDWVVFDWSDRCCYLKGMPMRPIMGREHFNGVVAVGAPAVDVPWSGRR